MKTSTRVVLAMILVWQSGACRGSSDAPAPDAAVTAPALDEATLKQMSHAFLEAHDRADDKAFGEALGPTFSAFEAGHVNSRESILKVLTDKRARNALPVTRTYGEEHLTTSSDAAVFIGDSTERYPVDGDHPAGDFEGWNTLVWVRSGAAWKVAHWQWEKAGIAASREMWNGIYRSGKGFNPKPNQLVVDTIRSRKPGAALDVATGQGRNAIYLASQGWQVTGFDIAEDGLDIARLAAKERGLTLTLLNADQSQYDYGTAKWDLIAFIYAGGGTKDEKEKVTKGLKKGGIVILEGFSKSASRSAAAAGYAPGELTLLYKDGFTILKDDTVEDVSDWGQGQKTKVVRFVAEKR